MNESSSVYMCSKSKSSEKNSYNVNEEINEKVNKKNKKKNNKNKTSSNSLVFDHWPQAKTLGYCAPAPLSQL